MDVSAQHRIPAYFPSGKVLLWDEGAVRYARYEVSTFDDIAWALALWVALDLRWSFGYYLLFTAEISESHICWAQLKER